MKLIIFKLLRNAKIYARFSEVGSLSLLDITGGVEQPLTITRHDVNF